MKMLPDSSRHTKGKLIYFVAGLLFLAPPVFANGDSTRHLTVTYHCYLTNIPENSKAVDWWIPVPSSDDRQNVQILQPDLKDFKLTTETKYGNRMYHRRINASSLKQADTFSISISYRVSIGEKAVTEAKQLSPLPKVAGGAEMKVFLSPNKLIPLKGIVEELTEQLQLPSQPIIAARQVYDYLINTMVYNYKAPGAGRGDVIWACTNKTGDCSDYHSIFIGVCRSSGIPADHIFGLPLRPGKTEAKDWHCWAAFWVDGPGWITIDASEAAKHPELRDYNFGTLSSLYLTLSHGRDVVLAPAQKGEALNIFADPYVEADGKAVEGASKWIVTFSETGARL